MQHGFDFDIEFPSYKAGQILLPEEINKIIEYILNLGFYTQTIKEDFKAEYEEQKIVIEQLRTKIDELERQTQENSNFKDELETLKLQQIKMVNQFQSSLERLEKQQKKEIILDCGYGAYLPLVLIPGGEFTMGGIKQNEQPEHPVKINSFYISRYPVPQFQYKAVMGSNPSSFNNNDTHPVDSVSWEEAKKFCEQLSISSEMQVFLPSEAQWEYACRAGTRTKYFFGNQADDLNNYGWFEKNSNNTTHSVGLKHPNSWDLYDMHGGIREWCLDEWHDNYQNAPDDGRPWSGDSQNNRHVLRGGSWNTQADLCTSASRDFLPSDIKLETVGFRIACNPH